MNKTGDRWRRMWRTALLTTSLCLVLTLPVFALDTSYTPVRVIGTNYNWAKAAVHFVGMQYERPVFRLSHRNVFVIVLYNENGGAFRWVCQIARMTGAPDVCSVFFNDTDSLTPPTDGWYLAYEFGSDPYEGPAPQLAGGRPHPSGRGGVGH